MMDRLRLGLSAAAVLALAAGGAMAQEANSLRFGLIEDADTLDPVQGRSWAAGRFSPPCATSCSTSDENANVVSACW